VRRYQTPSGSRIFDEYHLDVSRRFSIEESDRLAQTVVLAAAVDSADDSLVVRYEAPGCSAGGQGPALIEGIKEEQPEQQSEDHEEDNVGCAKSLTRPAVIHVRNAGTLRRAPDVRCLARRGALSTQGHLSDADSRLPSDTGRLKRCIKSGVSY
jgi:hypothetical protein